MIKKYNKIKSIILPNKKINIFIICLIVLGLTIGSIFSVIISQNDQNLVIEKIKLFIDNINNNSLNSLIAFKNSISINYLYIIIIWILGMTLIGIPINIFILFFKSFTLGFSLSSFIITYSYKGLLLSSIYLILGQLINIIVLLVLTIYSIMFSSILIKNIFKNNLHNKLPKFLKNYCIILIIVLLVSLISSLSETFLMPTIIKLLIKLYI